MTKLGTPIGAGPNCATVSPGFVGAGEPSGFRRAGCSIFCLSPLRTSLAPFPFLLSLSKRPFFFLVPPVPPPPPPVVVVVLPVLPSVAPPPPPPELPPPLGGLGL